MALQEFLTWLPDAPPTVLAEGAGKLARAYLYGELSEPEREDARRALTLLVDHASPAVRSALAESLAFAGNAPHYLVHALANDSSDVAAVVLARSPLLSEAELVDCAATADSFAQTAIALRPSVPAPVCAALAEVGTLDALRALTSNPGADLLEFSLRRIIERHGDDEDLRAALLARPNLPASICCDLRGAAAMAHVARISRRARLRPESSECLMRDAREQAIIKLAAENASETKEMVNLLAHLRRTQQLTAGLLLRGLLCGNKNLFEFGLCELTGLPLRHVAGVVASAKSAGFAALYRKAGISERLLPVFIASLEALKKFACAGPMTARLQTPLINSVLHACLSMNTGELDHVVTALRRLESEAALDETREFQARAVAKTHSLPQETVPMPTTRERKENEGAILIDLEAFEAALMAA